MMITTQVNDIYSFINSRDIGEYCRKIKHQFNPLEAAYLIWRSERRTLKERHIAWKELINTTPDMPIPDTQYKSLYEFLNSYMEMENNYLEEFYTADNNSVYFCNIYDEYGEQELFPQDCVFKTIEDCFAFIRKLNSKINITDFYISKSSITENSGVADRFKNAMGLKYLSNFEPHRIITLLCKTELFHTFCKLCPIVPTPFKQGDIVRIYNAEYHITKGKPTAYVLDTIGYWDIDENETKLNKSTNYNAVLYSFDELDSNSISYIQLPDSRGASNEIEAWGFTHNYLDLEYYHGELKGKERILTGISNYLQGNINLSFLMNTYSVMTAETNFRRMILPIGFYGWDNTILKLGGWTNTDIAKFEKINYDLWKGSENLANENDI